MTSGPDSGAGFEGEGRIIAVHGFLGLPRDWQRFGYTAAEVWPSLPSIARAPDAFSAWVQYFFEHFPQRVPAGRKPILIGYSLGGRLAMHLLCQHPQLFSGAILVSANPGLASEDERIKRLAQDQIWAKRFLSDEWTSVIADWNAQPVFQVPGGTSPLVRKSADFDRQSLAAALDLWSLGRQGDLRSKLATLQLPLLYITGEHDQKFTALTAAGHRPAQHQHIVLGGAGHRVPWDRPEEFQKQVAKFAGRCGKHGLDVSEI